MRGRRPRPQIRENSNKLSPIRHLTDVGAARQDRGTDMGAAPAAPRRVRPAGLRRGMERGRPRRVGTDVGAAPEYE